MATYGRTGGTAAPALTKRVQEVAKQRTVMRQDAEQNRRISEPGSGRSLYGGIGRVPRPERPRPERNTFGPIR